jgi:hypothetical protein
MSNINITETIVETVVIVIRYQNKISWYRSDRDLWVLDLNKWRDDFLSRGYAVPNFSDNYRFGISIVNQETVQIFLNNMSTFEISKDELSIELARRYTSAESWWDVMDLFPIMFVDFDNSSVAAFYPEGTPMERYIPDGWTGEFIDFADEYPEELFPEEDKFWIKGDADLLKLLNERAANLKS